MAVLIVLFASWLVFRGIGALGVEAFAGWRGSARYALAVMFLFTALAHFNQTRFDLARMLPSTFPKPMALIYATGVLELLGAAGLLIPSLRLLAAACLIALLLAMFPANLKAAREGLQIRGRPATRLGLRIPMQILFIALLWWSAIR